MKRLMSLIAVAAFMIFTVPTSMNAVDVQTPVLSAQDEVTYEEISKDELPEVITTKLSDAFKDYTVNKTYKGSDGTFKVEVNKNDSDWYIYFDKEGTVFKKEEKKDDEGTTKEEESMSTEE